MRWKLKLCVVLRKSALKSADLTRRHAFYSFCPFLLLPAWNVDLMTGNPDVIFEQDTGFYKNECYTGRIALQNEENRVPDDKVVSCQSWADYPWFLLHDRKTISLIWAMKLVQFRLYSAKANSNEYLKLSHRIIVLYEAKSIEFK